MENPEFHSPRQIRSQETVNRILSATAEIIKTENLNSLTVKNVCKLAGISNGVFFHFFKSKNELIAAYMHADYERYIQENPLRPDGKDITSDIIYYYLHNMWYCEEIGVEFVKHYYSPDNKALIGQDANVLITGPCYDHVIALVRKGLEIGYFKTDSSAFEITADLGTLVKGILFEWVVCSGNFDAERSINKMCRIYLNSLNQCTNTTPHSAKI